MDQTYKLRLSTCMPDPSEKSLLALLDESDTYAPIKLGVITVTVSLPALAQQCELSGSAASSRILSRLIAYKLY